MDATLEKMALARVALSVISVKNVADGIYDCYIDEEYLIKEWIDGLAVPNDLKRKLKDTVEVITCHVAEWVNQLRRDFYLHDVAKGKTIGRVLKMSSKGTIDELETARNVVNDSTIQASSRFKFACMYSMVEDMKRLRKNCKQKFVRFTDEEKAVIPLEYWTRNLADLLERLPLGPDQLPEEYGLDKSRYVLHSTAYFYGRLPEPLKERNILEIARSAVQFPFKADIMVFALKEMNEKQRNTFCANEIFKVLSVLCKWPYFECFESMCREANVVRWMEKMGYEEWQHCVMKIMTGWFSCYHHQEGPLRTFWETSPGKFREEICRSREHGINLVDALVRKGFLDLAKVVFSEVKTKKLRLKVIYFLFCQFVSQYRLISEEEFTTVFSVCFEDSLKLRNMRMERQYHTYAHWFELSDADLERFNNYLDNFKKE